MSTPETSDTAQSKTHAPSTSNPNSHDPSKRSSRFRFKSEHSRASIDDAHQSRSRSPASSGHCRRYRRRHHHGRHRRERSRPPSPLPNTDDAFRLSLFDALGDDEGAAFWEGVYGQPIHTYSDQKVGPDGELERMTEEEYTAYVRRRMWEKSWEGIEDARKAKAKEQKENAKREEEEGRSRRKQAELQRDRDIFDFEVEASLKRGEKRKREKAWRQRWEEYLKTWSSLNIKLEELNPGTTPNPASNSASTAPDQASPPLRSLIPWPTESARQRDVSADEVTRFFRNAVLASSCVLGDGSSDPQLALMTALKTERVRWHPDKMQHRYGRLGAVDKRTLDGVTAVFQIIDRMWNEEREKD